MWQPPNVCKLSHAENVRMRAGELDDRARLGLAHRVLARAHLFVRRRPSVRKIPIHVGVVVGEIARVRNVRAVEIFDVPLGPHFEKRSRVFDAPREEHAGHVRRFDVVPIRIAFAHDERETIAVDVRDDPSRHGRVMPPVARIRSHVAPFAQHRLGAVGTHARQDVEENFAQSIAHVLRKIANGLRPGVERDDVFRDGERDARSAELGRVHVSVDPRGRPRAITIASDDEQEELAPFERLPDTCNMHAFRMRFFPRAHHRGHGVVAEVLVAKTHRAVLAETALERDAGQLLRRHGEHQARGERFVGGFGERDAAGDHRGDAEDETFVERVTENHARVARDEHAAFVHQRERVELARARVRKARDACITVGVGLGRCVRARPRLKRRVLTRVKRPLGFRKRRPHDRVEEVVPVSFARRHFTSRDVRVVEIAERDGTTLSARSPCGGDESHAGALRQRAIDRGGVRPIRVFYK